MAERDFQRILEEARALQRHLPELGLVAVGGTAVALHCHHRVSLDVDQVTLRLQDRYEQALSALEQWDGWTTNRLNPPVLILGERHGVELGLRQQRRTVPLQTVIVDGLVVAAPAEMLRIKAFLLAERRSVRDFLDVAALARQLGEPASLAALSFLNLLYPGGSSQSLATRFAEACESEPVDLAAIPLPSYKGLQPPFTDWAFVSAACQRLGRALLKLELANGLPERLSREFQLPACP
ncbi:MAG: hypothetical protein FJ395_21340 [Verrucomicrobia bacterium]|nr:hypothetical protein [Verrucomicrobiota bacterium]